MLSPSSNSIRAELLLFMRLCHRLPPLQVKLTKTLESERSRFVPPGMPILKKSTKGEPIPAEDRMSTSPRSVHLAEASGSVVTPSAEQFPLG